MNSPNYTLHPSQPLPRETFVSILQSAIIQGELRFARQAALAWLGSFPGDLPISVMYAQILLQAGYPQQALPILERVCHSDPEYLDALEALVKAEAVLHSRTAPRIGQKSAHPFQSDRIGWLLALGGSPETARSTGLKQSVVVEKALTSWSRFLAKARSSLMQQDLPQAEQDIHQVLAFDPRTPLAAATHLKILQAKVHAGQAPKQSLHSLANHYHLRWPDCLQCSLVLSDVLMESGQPEEAVNLLHQTASKDITGQVAIRLWGNQHPYRSLWPELLETELDVPIPASVAAALGWNCLPEGRSRNANSADSGISEIPTRKTFTSSPKNASTPTPAQSSSETVASLDTETLVKVQDELERMGMRLNQPGPSLLDSRYPVYVIMTAQKGLEKRYSTDGAAAIQLWMKKLAAVIRSDRNWDAVVFYADLGVCITDIEKQVTRPLTSWYDAWGLKLALADLDKVLSKRGERIGALLIVGGPDVVPFHHLPNPVDDSDVDVPSDNPYGTADENYFIPDWPVGRLPDGAQSNGDDLGSISPDPMIHLLEALVEQHSARLKTNRASWQKRLWRRLTNWLSSLVKRRTVHRRSLGYTAAVWRLASLEVFRPIGEARAMRVSPPAQPKTQLPNQNGPNALPATRLAYFNLHGLEDAAEWFGQREPKSGNSPAAQEDVPQPGDSYDYPVAVTPADVTNSGSAPQVVFTEACYGAHIFKKTFEQALALKFLQSGSQAVVGSTCISYGSIRPPLIAADYLGHAFWHFLRQGLPAGDALLRARLSLAREMDQRQGYLDGEDQKTLISFVLYGDPLATAAPNTRLYKSIGRPLPKVEIPTVCDLAHDDDSTNPIPEEIVAYVKSVVEHYLPGMKDAQLTYSREHLECEPGSPGCGNTRNCDGPTVDVAARQAKNTPGTSYPRLRSGQPVRRVITLSKQVQRTTQLHQHYARLTLNAQGKLVKLVVSR